MTGAIWAAKRCYSALRSAPAPYGGRGPSFAHEGWEIPSRPRREMRAVAACLGWVALLLL